jgi:signal peptidase I
VSGAVSPEGRRQSATGGPPWITNALRKVRNGRERLDARLHPSIVSRVSQPAPRFRRLVRFLLISVGGLAVVVVLARLLVFDVYRVPSASMAPTLLVGDLVVSNRWAYGVHVPFTHTWLGARLPERGDVVVFERPDSKGGPMIRRVIGLPGDAIDVSDRRVTINGKPLPTHALRTERWDQHGDLEGPGAVGEVKGYTVFDEQIGVHTHLAAGSVDAPRMPPLEGHWDVPAGSVFVLGDSRDNSLDSRYGPEAGGYGPVPVDHLRGHILCRWVRMTTGGPRFDRAFTPVE